MVNYMERLTRRLSNGDVVAWNPLEYYNYNDFKKVLERLAEYEDTGLEPEDIEIGWWSPVCVNCDGKTEDGCRTEKCTYVHSDDYGLHYAKCAKQSKLLYKLAKAYKDGKLVILE